MTGGRIRHSGERFPLVPTKLAIRLGVAAAVVWLGLAGLATFEYFHQGPPSEDTLGSAAEFTVYAIGYALVCTLFLPGLANVIVIGEGGVALERWGITRWHVPWAAVKGWQRERDTNGNLVGLLLVDQQGRARRVGLGVISLGDAYYERIISASRAHAPGLEELPDAKVFRVSSGCVVVLIFVALFLLLLLVIQATSPR